MTQQSRLNQQKIARRRQEMRASLILPIGITFAVWLAGLVAFLLLPEQFYAIVTLLIGVGMFIFLAIWTRNATPRVRRLAVALAVPALIGIALGMVYGRASYALLGVGITMALLLLQRIVDTPISFRFASRQFQNGSIEAALELVNRAINARPDFWQSYQLRALIYLTKLDFLRAEKDAQSAIERNPKAHPAYNTLGQVYLADGRFTEAADVYNRALDLAPDYALYYYHLGLAQYRLGRYDLAADSLASASQGSLPIVEYDLQAYYYLGRSLEETGENTLAAEAFIEMAKFANGLWPLTRQLENQPDYPHLAYLRADLADIERRLPATSSSQTTQTNV
ncbi:MAG: tetratricopeptide repeat protein [Chloroflexi bacterium]|nr:tetratricopeptide repeat protein [Chloroflexota bacterium]